MTVGEASLLFFESCGGEGSKMLKRFSKVSPKAVIIGNYKTWEKNLSIILSLILVFLFFIYLESCGFAQGLLPAVPLVCPELEIEHVASCM